MTHKAEPGKLLLVEHFEGEEDKTFDVNDAEEGLAMAKGMNASFAVLDLKEFVRYELVDEAGAPVPWPKAA